MIKEFVTYEQALAVKELGYNEECFAYYYNKELSFGVRTSYGEVVESPLKSQVFRWFRDRRILGEVRPIDDWNHWGFLISEKDCQSPFYISYSTDMDFKEYYTYEEAENACINKLIELAKQQDNKNKCLECGEDKGNYELYCSFCRNQI